MKTILLTVGGTVNGDELPEVRKLRDQAEKAAYEADSESKRTKAHELAIAYGAKAGEAETAALATARETAAALVEALREAGVTVTAAALTVNPRPGSHEAPERVDLAEPPADPNRAVSSEAPVAATEGTGTGDGN